MSRLWNSRGFTWTPGMDKPSIYSTGIGHKQTLALSFTLTEVLVCRHHIWGIRQIKLCARWVTHLLSHAESENAQWAQQKCFTRSFNNLTVGLTVSCAQPVWTEASKYVCVGSEPALPVGAKCANSARLNWMRACLTYGPWQMNMMIHLNKLPFWDLSP